MIKIPSIFRRGDYPEKLMANLKAYYTDLADSDINKIVVDDAFDRIAVEIESMKEAITPIPTTYPVTTTVRLWEPE